MSERPPAYIIILGDESIAKKFSYDPGIVAQTIMLGATEKGLAGCIIGNINRDELRKELNVPDSYKILLVIALGMPAEESVIEPISANEGIRYWRDDRGKHHVPKRQLFEVLLDQKK